MNARRANRGARRGPGRRRRPGTAALILLSAAIAATTLLALGARSVVARTWCANHPVTVHVAAAAEIEPAIVTIGRYFNRQHLLVSGHCARVAVRAAPPGTVAAQLLGRGGGSGAEVDAWIPDSGLWPELARTGPAAARPVRDTGLNVAQTPLVIVMPRSAAARLPAFGSSVSWRFLLPHRVGGPSPALGLHVQFPDPTESGPGLASLVELQRLLPQGAAAQVGLARFVLNAQVVPAPGGQASLAALAVPASVRGPRSAPVTVIPEQEAIQFDRVHPSDPLAVRYPSEGTYDLSFPYVLTTGNRLMTAAAERFGRLLRSPYATAYLRYQGFRSNSGAAPAGRWPAWYGLMSGQPRLVTQVTPAQAELGLHAWQRLTLGSHDLALIDVSGSMAVPAIPGGPTLAQVTGQAAGLGLARFPDSTQLGLWAFASHISGTLPYKQLVPLGPLPAPDGLVTRRQEIARIAHAGQALPRVPADLYGAILAAYQRMTATYLPHYVNTVIVLTAGVDNDPTGITARALVKDLRGLYNPQKPVEVVAIMIGRAGNFRALRRIAAATGGQAADIVDPQQIGQVFYQAMAQRLCQPHCTAG